MYCKQQTECKKWCFENIPEFTGGKLYPLFADCGEGLNVSSDSDRREHSFMHTVKEVSAEETEAYIQTLKQARFEQVFENRADNNLFFMFSCPEGMLYVSFLHKSATARIILDRCANSAPCDFGYDNYEQIHKDTLLVQYSLHYGEMIRGTTCDCGMNYIYRLHDNSVIIIDGGEFEQATEVAVDDYMSLLHEITGTAKTEKIRVSLWICTHAHNDHCDLFSKLIRFHCDELEVERVAFNFPETTNTHNSDSVITARQRISKKYPCAAYIKIHAGCKFNIANAIIEVLVGAEDTIGNDDNDPFPGTNDTSALFKITADGVSTLFLADCGDDNGAELIKNYKKATLDVSFVQAAHHGINEIYDVYDHISAKIVLLPQCKMNMDKRFADVYKNLAKKYGKENILFAHDATDIFTLCNGNYTHTQRPHKGTPYDGSEW